MKQDYKEFVYIRIPKSVYEDIIENNRKLSANELKVYRYDYLDKHFNKRLASQKARKAKERKTALRILQTLENYYLGLFRKQNKPLSIYTLSKLSKVNYRTAKRFFKKYNLDEWIPRFEKEPTEALKEFKILELSEILS